MPEAQREHKDRLFKFIFGSPERKNLTLDLYNALNGTSYDDPQAIELVTIDEVLYMGMRNDVSFLVGNQLSLWEQQSTFNANMPLRMLQYLSSLYEKEVVRQGANKYGEKVVTLPAPKLVVFYNGSDNQPDERTLQLSDAFKPGSNSDVHVRVRAVNINRGRSQALQASCKPLFEYSWLVGEVRDNRSRGMVLDKAIGAAIDAMPREYGLRGLLAAHRAEVLGMLLTEYNEAEAMELFRKEGIEKGIEIGIEEGIEEGIEIGVIQALAGVVRKGLLTVEQAAEEAGLSAEEFAEKAGLIPAVR